MLNKIINKIQNSQSEEKKLVQFILSLKLNSDQKILDIGCGFGAKLRLIKAIELHAIGVDINLRMVSKNQEDGLACMTVEDFNRTSDKYDVLLMSHVIEHLSPKDLLNFIDNYLDRLKIGGYLIITTPLLSSYFYDDFDHIKPYQPEGVNMVFGGRECQVQFDSRNQLELHDIWFRRAPFKLHYFAGLYLKKYSRIPKIINLISALIFRLSFEVIGKTDGWMGLYCKTSL
jgi:cyclopropane fatty-acyl-phospholipid synthase-like methyltransferase